MASINDQFNARELGVLLTNLRKIIDTAVKGDVVELGCYKGLTSLQIATMLKTAGSPRNLYLYDSFAGLPAKTAQDQSPAGTQFTAGQLPARKSDVLQLFQKAGLPVPTIKKAWFSELVPDDLPSQIALAFLDGDFYNSVMDSLTLVWPKLTPGAVVIIDDYQNEALPGAQKAVDEWLKTHPAKLNIEASLAVIHPTSR